jgi:hypothetical protein
MRRKDRAETLTMRSLTWFVISPPRWLRHSYLALLASRRRGRLGKRHRSGFSAPSIEHYDGWTYPQSEERHCYLPSWLCEQPTPRSKLTP